MLLDVLSRLPCLRSTCGCGCSFHRQCAPRSNCFGGWDRREVELPARLGNGLRIADWSSGRCSDELPHDVRQSDHGDTPWEHPHAGMDIVCPPATMVVAVADGVFHRDQGAPIACSYPPGRLGGLGSFGVLSAGGRTYLYGHLEAFAAPDGAHVTIGQPLGFEGLLDARPATTFTSRFSRTDGPSIRAPSFPAGYPDPHDSTGLRCWGAAPP